MQPIFPSKEWLQSLENKLNNDDQYARIAKNWEGDMYIIIEPEGNLKEELIYYLDLWHGKCRKIDIVKDLSAYDPKFILKASYGNILRIMKGELDPMQAMLTRKLGVQGNMAVMVRNVPTVLDFVRCAREITSTTL